MKIRLVILTVVFFIEHLCREINADNMQDNDEVNLKIKFIYPGTKWCGNGNNADNYDDLGPQRETDKCCRTHDYCPDLIEAGESKHGLTNSGSYTKLNCECDDKFYDCLKAVDNSTSRIIGRLYFNTLNTQCFKEEYPIVSCANETGGRKCLEYKLDTNGEKKYQWFDVKQF